MRSVGGRPVADWLLLLRVAVASLAGGGSAIAVLWALRDDLPRPGVLLGLTVLVATLIVLALAALMSDRTGPPQPRAGGPPGPARSGPLPDRAAVSRRGEPALELTAALPSFERPPPVDRRPRTTPSVVEHPVPGASPPSAAVRRIVQCPGCGDFGIEVRRRARSVAMTCRRCAHAWEWGPGRPWPPTVVRPPGTQRGPASAPAISRRSS